MNFQNFIKKNISIPPDGSCFLHCILKSFENDKTFNNLIFRYLKINSDKIQIIRILLAKLLIQEDFDNYNILCIGEPDNISIKSLVELKHHIVCENMYMNEIFIDKLIKLFNNEYGFYIFCDGELISKKEWLKKDKNIFIDFVYDCHYELISLIDKKTGLKLPLILSNEYISTNFNF